MRAPKLGLSSFGCPFCSAFAGMTWQNNGTIEGATDLRTAKCAACSRVSVWRVERPDPGGAKATEPEMIYPLVGIAPPMSKDTPTKVVRLYSEAALVSHHSPKAAAALLRLALQVLLKEIGLPGKNINDDIAALVERGLPIQIQQAMDVLRIVGNNAVHPGQIDLDDSPDVVTSLFGLLNLVVDNQISAPKRIQAMWDHLPEGQRAAVKKRDGNR